MKIYIFLIMIFLLNPVFAEPKINTNFKYYKIYPSSKMGLDKAMYSSSPIKDNGNTFHGNTAWYVKWKFKWKKINGICKITKVDTFLDVTFTTPKIAQTCIINQDVRLSFDKYYKVLMKHEEGHMKSGLYAAREIEKTLYNFDGYQSCKQLEELANAMGYKIIKKYNLFDKEYDRKTKHGKLEGVDIRNFIQ